MAQNQSQATRPYEAVVVVHSDTTTEEQKAVFKKNKETIESFGGKIHSLETWGKRNLANPINKMKKAYFFHTTFEAGPQAILELERTMRINEKVLRFVHTKLDERISISKHLEIFKRGLAESMTREKEREARAQSRRAAAAASRAE